MCKSLFDKGKYFRTIPVINTDKLIGDKSIKNYAKNLDCLAGMLAHVYAVKIESDLRSSDDKRSNPTAIRRLYKKFLFYRHFIAGTLPLIIPEGKTDAVYLRSAIQHLPEYHARLGRITAGSDARIRFMSFSDTIRDILQLGSGSGDLFNLIKDFEKNLRGYYHAPLSQPVIILIDNDDGAKSILSYVSQKWRPATLKSTESFFYLDYNLYLIKTPAVGLLEKTCVEDMFPQKLLKTVVDGKSFDADKKHEEPGKYGKTVFAMRVVVPQKATIDFTGFCPLLDRIVAALDHHKQIRAGVVPELAFTA